MFARIERLNEDGLAILLIEQNVGQSLEIARHAYVLKGGAIAFHGTLAELFANSELKRAYPGI
jgi:branched-chain amino acid transport system ATP-binding protein